SLRCRSRRRCCRRWRGWTPERRPHPRPLSRLPPPLPRERGDKLKRVCLELKLPQRHPAGSPGDPKDLGGGRFPPAQILPARRARPQDDSSSLQLLVSPLPGISPPPAPPHPRSENPTAPPAGPDRAAHTRRRL